MIFAFCYDLDLRGDPLFRRLCFLLVVPFSLLLGCELPAELRAPARVNYGQVYVLPGIEGGNVLARNIGLGLAEGGVKSAIEVYDWTIGVPGGFVVNLAYYERNRRIAREFADEILAYQARHPDRPVHLVGHSGGAGIVVFALESLPDDVFVDSAVLLGAALSQDYDLSDALAHVRNGMINFYSRRDVGFLKVGTSLLGPIDREFGVAAGAEGFTPPAHLAPEARKRYAKKLRQIGWNPRLERYGADGTHLGWAKLEFARRFIAPIVTRNEARYKSPPPKTTAPIVRPAAPSTPAQTQQPRDKAEDAVLLPGLPPRENSPTDETQSQTPANPARKTQPASRG